MREMGFSFCPVDAAVACISFEGSTIWVPLYVDDVLIATKEAVKLEGVKRHLLDMYEGTNKGELHELHMFQMTLICRA
jgi:hypothetical protein